MISATRIMSKNKELICRLSCYDICEVFQEKTNKKNPENKVHIKIRVPIAKVWFYMLIVFIFSLSELPDRFNGYNLSFMHPK